MISEPHRGRAADRARRLSHAAIVAHWTCALLWVAAVAWIYNFGASRHAILQAQGLLGLGSEAVAVRDAARLPWAVYALLAGCAVAAVALAMAALGLAIGAKPSRSLRRWLGVMTLACLWLGLAVGWPALHWYGQQRRVGRQLKAVAEVAAQLTADWPTTDGEIESWGAYLAYPKGVPSTLLLLSNAPIPGADFAVSTVERMGADGVAFEIAGDDAGAWLCWRPDGSPPESFVGGLQTRYLLRRSSQLAPQWFIAQFQPGA